MKHATVRQDLWACAVSVIAQDYMFLLQLWKKYNLFELFFQSLENDIKVNKTQKTSTKISLEQVFSVFSWAKNKEIWIFDIQCVFICLYPVCNVSLDFHFLHYAFLSTVQLKKIYPLIIITLYIFKFNSVFTTDTCFG